MTLVTLTDAHELLLALDFISLGQGYSLHVGWDGTHPANSLHLQLRTIQVKMQRNEEITGLESGAFCNKSFKSGDCEMFVRNVSASRNIENFGALNIFIQKSIPLPYFLNSGDDMSHHMSVYLLA